MNEWMVCGPYVSMNNSAQDHTLRQRWKKLPRKRKPCFIVRMEVLWLGTAFTAEMLLFSTSFRSLSFSSSIRLHSTIFGIRLLIWYNLSSKKNGTISQLRIKCVAYVKYLLFNFVQPQLHLNDYGMRACYVRCKANSYTHNTVTI